MPGVGDVADALLNYVSAVRKAKQAEPRFVCRGRRRTSVDKADSRHAVLLEEFSKVREPKLKITEKGKGAEGKGRIQRASSGRQIKQFILRDKGSAVCRKTVHVSMRIETGLLIQGAEPQLTRTLPQHGGTKPFCFASHPRSWCPNPGKDAAFYVEVKFAKTVRKTGFLNDEGEPVWNGTFTFSKHEVASVFKIRLKEVRKLGPDDLVGEAEVIVDELLADSGKDNARVSVFSPTRFLSSRKRQSSTGSIHLHLKTVDALDRAKIEIDTVEKSTEGIRALTNKTNSTAEAIGPVIEAADVMIDMVDNIAQIHPLFNVSWQAISALYKLVSQQLHTDSELIDLVGKMRMAFDFSKETSDLDDNTKMLKPIVKNLLSETAECSRFVQEYAKYSFLGRMSKLGSGQKIRDYSTRFVERRKELDSIIGLNTAKEVLDIKSQQQLEVFHFVDHVD
ncbi:hypothetical protein ACEPAH_7848 [Sanghuangporus vaninii]